jgi:hypothetical protein
MRQIPVDTSAATVMVAKAPEIKLRDRRTGEIAVDADGMKLMTVDVMFAAFGEVQILTVTVPETGISGDLVMGTPVALTQLVARPWESEFNGRQRHGIAFRAVAVTSLVAGGSVSRPEAA